jgi:hypothetical protein
MIYSVRLQVYRLLKRIASPFFSNLANLNAPDSDGPSETPFCCTNSNREHRRHHIEARRETATTEWNCKIANQTWQRPFVYRIGLKGRA